MIIPLVLDILKESSNLKSIVVLDVDRQIEKVIFFPEQMSVHNSLLTSQAFHPSHHLFRSMRFPGCLHTHIHFSKAVLTVFTKILEFRIALSNSILFLKDLEEPT